MQNSFWDLIASIAAQGWSGVGVLGSFAAIAAATVAFISHNNKLVRRIDAANGIANPEQAPKNLVDQDGANQAALAKLEAEAGSR